MPNAINTLRFFQYGHLPPHLQEVSRPFAELARTLANTPQMDAEQLGIALQKLLESKDAAVRALLPKPAGQK